MNNTRDQFIETTCRLLETQGYHATGLKQIIKESGAPRGSLYYHFPGGKEELAAEAIERTGTRIAERIRQNLSDALSIADAVREFVLGVAGGVEKSRFSAGGPLTTIAMETATTNERLNLACRTAFTRIEGAFAEKLARAGFEAEQADRLAVFITASIEGGILLSRTEHGAAPLKTVAELLYSILEAHGR